MLLSRFLIYGLSDPETDELRYIGRSSSALKRPRSHWNVYSLQRNDHCHNWVKSILAKGLLPKIDVVEELEPGNDVHERLNVAEEFWIAAFFVAGCRLTNLQKGGLHPRHSFETIEKIRQSSKNVSEETRRKRSLSMKGKNTGPRSKEVRKKISKARKGISSGTRDHRGEKNPMYGKKLSRETIEKIRQSNIRTWERKRGT